MRYQAFILGDDLLFVPLGEPFEAKTSLEAVQLAKEYWPGLSPVIEETEMTDKIPVN